MERPSVTEWDLMNDLLSVRQPWGLSFSCVLGYVVHQPLINQNYSFVSLAAFDKCYYTIKQYYKSARTTQLTTRHICTPDYTLHIPHCYPRAVLHSTASPIEKVLPGGPFCPSAIWPLTLWRLITDTRFLMWESSKSAELRNVQIRAHPGQLRPRWSSSQGLPRCHRVNLPQSAVFSRRKLKPF